MIADIHMGISRTNRISSDSPETDRPEIVMSDLSDGPPPGICGGLPFDNLVDLIGDKCMRSARSIPVQPAAPLHKRAHSHPVVSLFQPSSILYSKDMSAKYEFRAADLLANGWFEGIQMSPHPLHHSQKQKRSRKSFGSSFLS